MPDSETVPTDVISKLHEVDPVFREVVSLLYGDGVDPREAYDVSKKAVTAEEKKRRRRQAQVGLASNVIGLGAGAAGTAAALRDDRFKDGGKVARKIHAVGQKIPKPISSKGGKVGAALAGGALGLQVANLAGDAVANRVLAREAKVKKSWDDGVAEIVAARRGGVIDTEQAIEMAVNLAKAVEADLDEISKWSPPGIVRGIRNSVTVQGKPFAVAPKQRAKIAGRKARRLHPVARANDRTRVATQVAHDASKGKTAFNRLVAGAGAAAGGAGGYAYGKKRTREQMGGAVYKREDELVDYGFTGEISKVDSDKRLAFGWCSLSEIDGEPVVDLQNDYAPIEEIEKSAYAYVISSRKGGDMHARDTADGVDKPLHTADLVESMIVTPDKLQQMGLSEQVAKSVPVGWWVGFKVNDDTQWERVKKGERAGFSIHGKGSRVSKVLG